MPFFWTVEKVTALAECLETLDDNQLSKVLKPDIILALRASCLTHAAFVNDDFSSTETLRNQVKNLLAIGAKVSCGEV
jgi:hypothetical protein